jgi:transposase
MSPQKLFHELLNLGAAWRVVEIDFDPEGGVLIRVEETAAFWKEARSIHVEDGAVKCYDHIDDVCWRHLNVFEHRCDIVCCLPRAQCLTTGKVYRVTPPWEGLSKAFTKAFEALAVLLMREMPVSAAARITGETDTRLWRLLRAQVERAWPRVDWSEVSIVGCDELSARKGHRYVSVFCDLVGKRVLFAVEGKDKSVWEKFVKALGEHNGHNRAITEISMDMSPAYIAGANENIGSQARVVFDKFHVVAHVSKAVDDTRRQESRQQRSARAALKGTQWLWRKNPDNLTEKEAAEIKELKGKHLATARAYQMRLILQDIYRLPDETSARQKLRAWCRWVKMVARKYPTLIFGKMLKAAAMIENHLEGILAHWKSRTTNAFLEGLNSVFSAVKRKARGFRSVKNLITMLYFTAGKLPLPATP